MNFSSKRQLVLRAINRLKDCLFITPFVSYWRTKLNGKLMVYLYHRIGEQGEHRFLDRGGSPLISEDEFRQDLAFLQRLGAKFIRIQDINECKFNLNEFYVAITIDDGFLSNYQTGLDVANELDIPLTIFQCSGMLDGKAMLWEHQLYWVFESSLKEQFKQFIHVEKPKWPLDLHLLRETCDPVELECLITHFLKDKEFEQSEMERDLASLYPSAGKIKVACQQGHEIASHGRSHYKRSSIDDEMFKQELLLSKQEIKNLIGQAPTSFSYPFNSYYVRDHERTEAYYQYVATVDGGSISQATRLIPRNTWPGSAKNQWRQRRWLLTGSI